MDGERTAMRGVDVILGIPGVCTLEAMTPSLSDARLFASLSGPRDSQPATFPLRPSARTGSR